MSGKSNLIFVVTGTQAPFDRLLHLIDNWSLKQDNYEVIAQTANSNVNFKNMQCYDFLEPDIFDNIYKKADVIIGHAGIGTIIKALENRKKLVVFPRLVKYNEHRNDHQLHTAKGFDKLGLINVAYNENDLLKYLNEPNRILKKDSIDNKAQSSLLDALYTFINK